jgi:CRP-like cAMP-binding protein
VRERGLVALLEAGSFFGEGCLNGQSRRLATAAPLTEGTAPLIAKKEMLRVLSAEPGFASVVIKSGHKHRTDVDFRSDQLGREVGRRDETSSAESLDYS